MQYAQLSGEEKSYLRGQWRGRKQDSFTDTGCRENKLDIDQYRMSQRVRRSQMNRQIATGSMSPSIVIQSEAKRSQVESISMEKHLCQNS